MNCLLLQAGCRFTVFSQPETSVRDGIALILRLKSLADASGYDYIDSLPGREATAFQAKA